MEVPLRKKRHPMLSFHTPVSITSARKDISVRVIKQWFYSSLNCFKETDATYALEEPTQNFNIDETGFCPSPSVGKVPALRRENETSITAFSCKRINSVIAKKFPSG